MPSRIFSSSSRGAKRPPVVTWQLCLAAVGYDLDVLRRFVELFVEAGGNKEHFHTKSSRQAARAALHALTVELDPAALEGPPDGSKETARQAIAQVLGLLDNEAERPESARERRARLVSTSEGVPLNPRELQARMGWTGKRGTQVISYIEERERVLRRNIWMRSKAGQRRVSIAQLRYHCPELFTATGRVSELHERFARYLPAIDEHVEARIAESSTVQALVAELESLRVSFRARQVEIQSQLEAIVASLSTPQKKEVSNAAD